MAPEPRQAAYAQSPYRLTTFEQVEAAVQTPPPGFTRAEMSKVVDLAPKLRLRPPPALSALPDCLKLRLYQSRRQAVRVPRMEIRTTAALSLERDPTPFGAYLPLVERIAREQHLGSFVSNLLAGDENAGPLRGEVRARLAKQLSRRRYHLVVRTMASHLRSLCKALLKSGVRQRGAGHRAPISLAGPYALCCGQ